MKVLWACMCACLVRTVVGKWAEEAVDELKFDMERQEGTVGTSSDTIATSTFDITTDSVTPESEITTIPEETTTITTSSSTSSSTSSTSSSTSTATSSTTSSSTTSSTTTSEPMTTSSPMGKSVLPVDCADLLMAGVTMSGVYDIYPFTCTCSRPVQVWCDMETDGGGWTVFLKRQKQFQQLDFNRTLDEYKAGFGNPYEEHWLGLELLHIMTYGRTYSLRLDLEVSGVKKYATRAIMKVESETNRFRVLTSGTESGSTNTRYCLRYMNYRYFTTIDQDNDLYRGNCAAVQGGGWWYYNCRYFNPTSIYTTAINLTCYGSSQMNVTALQLKLRPAICDAPLKAIHLREMNCGC